MDLTSFNLLKCFTFCVTDIVTRHAEAGLSLALGVVKFITILGI
jgi:hypothetical protein